MMRLFEGILACMKVLERFWDGKPGAERVASRVGNWCLLVADLPGGHSAWGMRGCHKQSPRLSPITFSYVQVAQLCERALRFSKEGPKGHNFVAKVKEFGKRLREMMGISEYQLISMAGGVVAKGRCHAVHLDSAMRIFVCV